MPILSGGEVVAVLAASNWKEDATLTRAQTVWKLRSRKGKRLIGTLSTDPEISDTGEQARFLAEQASLWRGTWGITLGGSPVHAGPQVVLARYPPGRRRRSTRSSAVPALDGVHPQPACLERGDQCRGRRWRRGCRQFMTALATDPARHRP